MSTRIVEVTRDVDAGPGEGECSRRWRAGRRCAGRRRPRRCSAPSRCRRAARRSCCRGRPRRWWCGAARRGSIGPGDVGGVLGRVAPRRAGTSAAARRRPASSGRSSSPPCTVSVTGAGGATVFGQSAPATESRSRLAGVERVGARVEHRPRRRTPRRAPAARLPRVHAVAVGEVERAARDQRRGAVGEHVAQLHRERRRRRVGADPQPHPRVADDAARRRRPTPRSASARRRRAGRPTGPRAGGRRSRSTPSSPTSGRDRAAARGPVSVGRPRCRAASGQSVADPEARRAARGPGSGARRGAHEDVGAVVDAPSAVRPRSQRSNQATISDVEVDPRAGDRGRRVGVRPRPGEQPVRDTGLARAPRRCGRSCCGSRPPSRRRASPRHSMRS